MQCIADKHFCLADVIRGPVRLQISITHGNCVLLYPVQVLTYVEPVKIPLSLFVKPLPVSKLPQGASAMYAVWNTFLWRICRYAAQ